MSPFGLSKRPDNWYSMSYDEQRAWERAERQHRDEVDDVERRERQAIEDADRAHARLDAARREHRAYVSELSEENDRLAEELADTRAQRDELLENARAVLKGFAAGVFVRNVADDDHSDWAIRALPHITALAGLEAAVVKAEGAA